MSIAINKEITNISATAGVWTATLSDVEGILVGMKADVDGFQTANWNAANVTITAVNATLKTVTYSHANVTAASQAADANFHLSISWIDTDYVADMLGFTPTGDDLVYLAEAVEAAEDWAYRKRAEAGYNPHPGYSGGADIRLGTGLYAMTLYRERGSVDSFASFQDMTITAAPGTMGQIMRLLGINRSQVA